MPVNRIRNTMVRTFRELEHPRIIAFHIGECGLGCKMSATHLGPRSVRVAILLLTRHKTSKKTSHVKKQKKPNQLPQVSPCQHS